MATTAKRDINVDISVKTKQLSDAVALMEKLSKLYKDLKDEGGSPAELKMQEESMKKVLKVIENINSEKKKSADNTKEQEKTAKELEKAMKAEASAAESLNKQRVAAYKKIEESREKERKTAEHSLYLMNQEVLTLKELREKNALLVKERDNLRITNAESSEKFNELTESIRKNQEQISKGNEDIGRHHSNVGNYLSVWSEAPGLFGQSGQAVSGLLENLTPTTAVLGGLSVVLGTLAKAFMETAGGMEVMDKVTAYTRAGWDMIRITADDLAKSIRSISFDKILGGLKEMITVPFKNIASQFGLLGDTVSAVFSGDFSKAGDSIKAFGVRAFELTKDSLMPLLGVFGIIGEKASGVSSKLNDLAKAHETLIKQQRNAEYATLGFDTAIAKLTASRDLLQSKVGADSLAFKGDEQRFKQLAKVSEELANVQRIAAKTRLDLAEAEVTLGQKTRKSSEEMLPIYQKQTQARIELINADNEYKQVLFDNAEEIFKRKMDLVDTELESVEAVFDTQKTVNERIMALETTTSEERAKLLKYNIDGVASNMKEMERLLSAVSGAQLNFTELLGITDQKYLKEYLVGKGMQVRSMEQVLNMLRAVKEWNQDNAEQEAANAALAASTAQKKYDASVAQFQKEQELEKLKFESKKTTEEELARFELEQTIALDQAKLSLADSHGIKMAEIDRKILEQKIANDKAALASTAAANAKGIASTKQTEDAKTKIRRLATDNGLSLLTALVGAESKAGKRIAMIQKGIALVRGAMDAKSAILKAWNSAPFPFNVPAILTTTLTSASLIDAIKNIAINDDGGASNVNTSSVASVATSTPGNVAGGGEGTAIGQLVGISPRVDSAAALATSQTQPAVVPVLVVDDVTDIQSGQARVAASKVGV